MLRWRPTTSGGRGLLLGLFLLPTPALSQDTLAEQFDPALVALGQHAAQLFADQRTLGLCLRGMPEGSQPGPLLAALDPRIIARGMQRVGVPPALCEQRTDAALLRASGVSLLLDLAWTVRAGDFALRTEALVADEGPWARFFRPPGGSTRSVHAASASVPRDAARVALGITPPTPWPLVSLGSRPRMVTTPFRDVVALAAGDLDGTPGDELVVVTLTTVHIARFDRGSLRFLTTAGTSLAPAGWAPVPRREPLGVASYVPAERSVRLRTSALAAIGSVRLVGDTVLVRPEPSDDDRWPLPSDDGLACAVLQGERVVRWWRRCGSPPEAPLPPDPAFRAAFPVVRGPWTAWCDGAGRCALYDGAALRGVLPDAAWPVEIVDLAETGTPSLVTASAAPPGSPDRVRSLIANGEAVREGATVRSPGPVTALTTADLTGTGTRMVIAALTDPAHGTSALWVWP